MELLIGLLILNMSLCTIAITKAIDNVFNVINLEYSLVKAYKEIEKYKEQKEFDLKKSQLTWN